MRILIVDDDLDDQMFMRWAIKEIAPGHECTIANNGCEAIAYIRKSTKYDIIFLDLNMPLMNGFDTLQTIRRIDDYKKVPVVVVSTSKNRSDIDRCKCLGATNYIVKPGCFHEMINELKTFLG